MTIDVVALAEPYFESVRQRVPCRSCTGGALFASPGLDDSYKSELRHKAVIDRFGRYPHRNAILGRESTQEELAFLEQPGSRF
jgi:uncharacterized protein (DUF924 family)